MNLHLDMDMVDGICHLAAPAPYKFPDFCKFTGNQWNENWEWDRAKLQRVNTSILMDIWEECRPTWLNER